MSGFLLNIIILPLMLLGTPNNTKTKNVFADDVVRLEEISVKEVSGIYAQQIGSYSWHEINLLADGTFLEREWDCLTKKGIFKGKWMNMGKFIRFVAIDSTREFFVYRHSDKLILVPKDSVHSFVNKFQQLRKENLGTRYLNGRLQLDYLMSMNTGS